MHTGGIDQLILSIIEETRVLLEVQILTDLAFLNRMANMYHANCKLFATAAVC